ncbi:MAG: site-specific recombinase [Rhodoferax sp.]|nr:site-specific recombinase [Rhodoferax sp.]MDO8449346.1 site-specific recombinase [Rhodoferax sp.]
MHDLPKLLDAIDPRAALVQRHLWLISLFEWLRGDCSSVPASIARVQLLLDAVQARPEMQARVQAWWQTLVETIDGTTLLADYGFSSRSAFVSEFAERIRQKVLPGTPETADASALFSLVLSHGFDARWLAALDEAALARIASLLQTPQAAPAACAPPSISRWQGTVLEAITFCTSQVSATGFSPELRLRMSAPARDAGPFHCLMRDFETLRDVYLAAPDNDSDERQAALQQFRERLEACRGAAASVYTHLDAHGISVNLVFQLRQLRERVLRIRALLDCLMSVHPAASTARLLSHLVTVGQERRSVRALIASNSSMLAAKVAERSSETGEHYITRTLAEYRDMLGKAAGGGALTALTTWLKFLVMTIGLSAFWGGFWAGVVYAASFVLIQLLHFTLATKQPAMTAPAMAAKLKDLSGPRALDDFADEVTHLVRSQVAAVLGNVLMVFPAVLLISGALQLTMGRSMIDAKGAEYVFHSLTLLGPTALFAAFTGVLLFAASIIAGWVENWFVLHRLDSAMRYNPRITAVLGVERARRWADFTRANVSGFASNISLGFMLGLIPAFTGFFGLGLDVRHVTLSAGQLAAACAAIGWDVVREPALWWSVAALPVIGALNLGVSFYLALRLALRAHNVTGVDRARIGAVIRRRWRDAPLSFFWPTRDAVSQTPVKD